jgi:dynein heavy chain 2, cytosolic
LEDSLLEELANSQGNILENTALLDSLTRTKSEAAKISQGLKESEILNAQLDQSREVYKPLACRGATLYLKIGQLNKVNNMYRFSLAYFTRLFLTCLEVK